MDDSPTDTAKVRDDLGTGDRLAMVVQKTGKWMRESSISEKLIVALMVAIFSMLIHLNREVGESIAFQTAHQTSHPNEAIEEDVDEINETLKHIDNRLDHLEAYQVYGPRPQE